jgi:hypothetical protein
MWQQLHKYMYTQNTYTNTCTHKINFFWKKLWCRQSSHISCRKHWFLNYKNITRVKIQIHFILSLFYKLLTSSWCSFYLDLWTCWPTFSFQYYYQTINTSANSNRISFRVAFFHKIVNAHNWNLKSSAIWRPFEC